MTPDTTASQTSTTPSIHPATTLGAVRLTVGDLDRAREFYEGSIGLRTLERAGDVVRLGADRGRPLVELVGDPDAPARPPRSTGLFHLALLVPSRVELARALRRVVQSGWRLTGASDHLVSEALYLDDPEGNGIELYRDRPRGEWRRVDGQLQMATLPLDLEGLAAELTRTEGAVGAGRPSLAGGPADAGEPAGIGEAAGTGEAAGIGEAAGTGSPAAGGPTDTGMAPGTRIGHVHLNVADLAAAEAFYHGLLGFDVMVRGYPGALFVSAGGYHHHLGLNTWAGEGAPPPPPGSRGLRTFDVLLPSGEELAGVAARLRAAGTPIEDHDGGDVVRDPAGNALVLRTV